MIRRRPQRCWYCGRPIRWAHYRCLPDILGNYFVTSCARCAKLKGLMTMREWFDALQDTTRWPKWRDDTRQQAIVTAIKYITRW